MSHVLLVQENANLRKRIAELEERIRFLERRHTEMQATCNQEEEHPDTRRLNWLESYSHLRIRTYTQAGAPFKHLDADGTALAVNGNSLRDAIDAAMRQEGGR